MTPSRIGTTSTEKPSAKYRARSGPPVGDLPRDIHAWNVLVTPEGDIVIVDWNSAMLAPRERDLMFGDGVAGGHAADPSALFDGYGDVEPDLVVLACYRIEWAVQHLAEFAAHVFLDPDAGEDTKAESMEAIVRLCAPGSEIDAVTREAPTRGLPWLVGGGHHAGVGAQPDP